MKKIVAVAALGIAIVLVALWMRTNRRPPETASSQQTPQTFNGTSNQVAAQPAAGQAAQTVGAQPQNSAASKEEESLKQMVLALSKYSQGGATFDDLIRDLQDSGQEPFIARDKNEYTGEMNIVRTKSPLPGTRYFHAQYFTDEKGERLLQHMSFEFRPGPGALEAARQAVYSAFPAVGSPTTELEGFMEWKLNDGYTVWIKKMEEENLDAYHPFNAYTKNDIGTIRVAIEEDPHAGMDGH